MALEDHEWKDTEFENIPDVENSILHGSGRLYDRIARMTKDRCQVVTKNGSIWIELTLKRLSTLNRT